MEMRTSSPKQLVTRCLAQVLFILGPAAAAFAHLADGSLGPTNTFARVSMQPKQSMRNFSDRRRADRLHHRSVPTEVCGWRS